LNFEEKLIEVMNNQKKMHFQEFLMDEKLKQILKLFFVPNQFDKFHLLIFKSDENCFLWISLNFKRRNIKSMRNKNPMFILNELTKMMK
jgi:predicted transcriptional regulator